MYYITEVIFSASIQAPMKKQDATLKHAGGPCYFKIPQGSCAQKVWGLLPSHTNAFVFFAVAGVFVVDYFIAQRFSDVNNKLLSDFYQKAWKLLNITDSFQNFQKG